MHLILVGMKGAGKSAVGKTIADRLWIPFFDNDTLMEDIHERGGNGRERVDEILVRRGEDYFNSLEARAFGEYLDFLRSTCPSSVFSFGGRAPLNPEIKTRLKAEYPVVYLKVPEGEIVKRILAKGIPSFVDNRDPDRAIIAYYRDRAPHYGEVADYIVDAAGLDIVQAAEKILDAVKGGGYAGK
jgi:shikimate kinase